MGVNTKLRDPWTITLVVTIKLIANLVNVAIADYGVISFS